MSNDFDLPQSQPLSGISVIDLTSNVAAPFGSAVLADLGAQVVHVEGPKGDDCRRMYPTDGTGSAYFSVVNRNKSAITLDIRDSQDRSSLENLIAQADVFVTNLRPGKLERLGLDDSTLCSRFPRLIHASLSAYGKSGIEQNKPGYDAVLQARTGIAAVTGEADGPPVRAGVSILDVGAGTWLALGVLAALLRRERTGQGGSVATSLFETGVSWVSYHIAAHQLTGQPSRRHGSGHPAFSPYGIYETADGLLCIGVGSDLMFLELCAALDRLDLRDDPRFSRNVDRSVNAQVLRAELEKTLKGRTAEDWARDLSQKGLPVDAVNNPEDLLNDQLSAETGILLNTDTPSGTTIRIPGLPLTFDGQRPAIRMAAPSHAPHRGQ